MKLYELSGNYAQLMDMVDNEEITIEEIGDTLESITGMIEDKVENIAKLRKTIEGDIKAFKEEEKRIANRRKALESKSDYLKNYVQNELIRANIKKLKAGTFNLYFQKNPASVEIIDESIIPEQYREKLPDKIKKDEIKKALQAGEEIIGVTLKEDGEHLRGL